MEKVQISPSQLFALIFLFELGSAVVVGLGMQAKQDAWLAILLGMTGGLLIFLVYSYLFRHYPNLALTSYLPRILGKWIGYPITFLYIVYFVYLASRVLRDFSDLLLTSTLRETPMLAISAMMIALSVYGIAKGIETLARTGEILFGLMIVLIAFGFFFLFASGVVKFENLVPVLDNGWKPVLKTAFPQTLTFPFGEMIVFAMLLPFLNKPKMEIKVGLSALTVSGLLLALTAAINIAVLGPYIASTSMFPLLKTVHKINIADFIQRLDAIVISMLIVGGFFKIVIFFYAAVKGIEDLFKEAKHRYIIIGSIGLIILVGSIYMAGNFPEHLEVGLKIVPVYLHLPFQIGIPLLLLIVVMIRKYLNLRR
ncbi:spore gernimation protein KB [Bacillus sp. V3-13]|uniref:GerAB/ArcD/ProY family transporter n=1 Tax=Bacillus sp. V3-13 TaxID=2053728 RepID=UPI000C75ADA6|nr:GerAB/ArcD/ProY family transporter [Bacillus sp. V3-13]PLR79098.1 spore gernimation protein KB [Bacillus sp. V3-13]